MPKLTFEIVEGERCETNASLKRQIAEITGFQYRKIVLLESSMSYNEILEANVFDTCDFSVNGKGFSVNLNTHKWCFNEVFDSDNYK